MQEVRIRLGTRGFGPTEIDDVVTRAIDGRLLDDRLFAKLWVEDRVRRRPLSRRAVEFELADRGVAPMLISEALAAGYPPEMEAEIAHRVAAERWPRDRSQDPDRRRRRVADYLIRRGFSASLAYDAVRRIESEEREDG